MTDNKAIIEIPRSIVKGSNKEDLGSVEDDRESMEQLGSSKIYTSIIEECADPMDEKDASEIEQKLNSVRKESCEVYT